jgi:hypothetical protein
MEAAGEVCIINIGPRERRRRMRWGIGALALGGVLAAILVSTGIPATWRVTLLLPFWIGALGVFQARGKT